MAIGTFLLIIFSIAIFVQLIFMIRFMLAFSRYRPPSNTSTEPVSVLVCAQNQEENLKKLIPALLDQSHPEFEVIIVNDRSHDGTYELLDGKSRENPKVKAVHIDRKPDHVDGKKYAVTLGVKTAGFENIVLTDADCVPFSNMWLTKMAGAFNKDTEIMLGYSGYEKQKGFLNYFIRFETLWTAIQYLGLALSGFPYMGVGRNLAWAKGLFMNAKGFNGYQQVTGGDDDLFVNRHAHAGNTAVILGSEAMTVSQPKTSWRAFFKQKLRHLSVGKHYSMRSRAILSIFSISHILSWLLPIALLLLGIDPYLVIGLILIRTLVVYLTLIIACKKSGEKFELWGLLILDCIFVLYYSLAGISALFTKKVKWI